MRGPACPYSPRMDADVVVIGCGPAGFYAARGAARAGLRSVMVESGALGGTGFRSGCLPVKMLLDVVRARKGAAGRAWGGALLRRTAAAMVGVEKRLADGLRGDEVEIVRGEAEFLDAHTVRAGGQTISAQAIVIATGTRPAAPAGIEMDGRMVVSHAEAVSWRDVPRSVAIVGGDVEGIELACLFAHLGSRVHVVELKPEILPGQDRDLVAPVETRLASLGVQLHLGAAASGVRSVHGRAEVLCADGRTVQVDRVIVTGIRRPNLPAGLDRAGVAAGEDRIPVDSGFRTNAPNIYAVGDINGLCGMAHAAIQQGMLIARIITGGRPGPAAWPSLPRAMFTIPEVAGAGAQARDLERRGTAYARSTVRLADTWRGISREVREGFVTVLAGTDGKLLGIWACGEGASEIAAPFGALVDRGATADDVLESLVIHPTLSEALLEACWPLSTAAGVGRQSRPPAGR
jgi:dihydrolipoamide dehydrogenase